MAPRCEGRGRARRPGDRSSEVAVAGPLRAPQPLAGLEAVVALVQVEVRLARLGVKRLPFACRDVEGDDIEAALVARLDLGYERALRPVHTCQIAVVIAGVHPRRRAAGCGDDPESDGRIRAARERITVRFLLEWRVAPLVDNAVTGDRSLVDLGVGERCRVRRPPEALQPVHLLLCDELGESVRDAVAGTARQLARLAVPGTGCDEELAIRDEPKQPPVR